MKRILQLVRKFIYGIDIGEDVKKDFAIAVDFHEDNTIGSLVVYNREVSDIDMGVSKTFNNNLKCKVFEIIWVEDDYEFWFVDAVLEMKINYGRLDLMKQIISEMHRYNGGR